MRFFEAHFGHVILGCLTSPPLKMLAGQSGEGNRAISPSKNSYLHPPKINQLIAIKKTLPSHKGLDNLQKLPTNFLATWQFFYKQILPTNHVLPTNQVFPYQIFVWFSGLLGASQVWFIFNGPKLNEHHVEMALFASPSLFRLPGGNPADKDNFVARFKFQRFKKKASKVGTDTQTQTSRLPDTTKQRPFFWVHTEKK